MPRPALRPEQERALAYVRAKGTEATAADVRRRVAAACTEIETLLGTLPAELTARRPDPATWSLHEVVDHLVESHRPAVPDLARLLAGEGSEHVTIPAGLLSADPFRRDWPVAVAELREVHRGLLASLSDADDATPTTARAQVEMVVRCATADGGSEPVHWIESFDWKAFALLVGIHTREHADQVRRIHARLTTAG
jgi:hypothetical protein